MSNSDELNKWVARLYRRLDGIPMTKTDREDVEELVTIVVQTTQKQLVAPGSTEPVKSRKDGGS